MYVQLFPLSPGVGLGSEAGADSPRCHQRSSPHEGSNYEARCNCDRVAIVPRGVIIVAFDVGCVALFEIYFAPLVLTNRMTPNTKNSYPGGGLERYVRTYITYAGYFFFMLSTIRCVFPRRCLCFCFQFRASPFLRFPKFWAC